MSTAVGRVTRIVLTCAVLALSAPGALADTEEEVQEASSGAAASNPTAAVNYQDIRYRYFDLDDGAGAHSFETEGAFVLHPRLKFTNELRGIRTDRSGDWETDLEILKLKAIFLSDIMPMGIKGKLALGVEWLKDLGDFDDGTGTGSDQIAPLIGIGWIPTEGVFLVTLLQYFHSYNTDDNAPDVRRTGPRIIYIRALPDLGGWFKVDFKAQIDHENDDEFTETLELQLGKMFNPHVGAYAEVFVGDWVLDTDAYDMGAGVGVRFMY
jgi:hypothetical protein